MSSRWGQKSGLEASPGLEEKAMGWNGAWAQAGNWLVFPSCICINCTLFLDHPSVCLISSSKTASKTP